MKIKNTNKIYAFDENDYLVEVILPEYLSVDRKRVEEYIKVHKLGEEWNAKQREKRQMSA